VVWLELGLTWMTMVAGFVVTNTLLYTAVLESFQ